MACLDLPHPGSYDHLQSTENYILYIIRRACFGNKHVYKTVDNCKLPILGIGGEDLFKEEVEKRVRSNFECRTEFDVAQFYCKEVRGTKDLPYHLLDLTSAPALAAWDGDVKALVLLRGHDLALSTVMAAHSGHRECLKLLHEWGCNLRQATKNGDTPAHEAALNNHIDCLRLLRQAGCDLGQANRKGETPAHAAARHGHEACLRLLKKAGCDLQQKNHDGDTPELLAAKEGHEGCLRLLKDL